MSQLIFWFQIYIRGVFCQHVFKKSKEMKGFKIYECTRCFKVMAVED